MIFKYIHVASCRNLHHPRLKLKLKLGTNKTVTCYFPHSLCLAFTLLCLFFNFSVFEFGSMHLLSAGIR